MSFDIQNAIATRNVVQFHDDVTSRFETIQFGDLRDAIAHRLLMGGSPENIRVVINRLHEFYIIPHHNEMHAYLMQAYGSVPKTLPFTYDVTSLRVDIRTNRCIFVNESNFRGESVDDIMDHIVKMVCASLNLVYK